jgi:hypothetical protein
MEVAQGERVSIAGSVCFICGALILFVLGFGPVGFTARNRKRGLARPVA